MGDWIIRWNFDREVYRPGDSGFVHFWLVNRGDTPLYAEETGLQFEWQESEWYPVKRQVQIPVGSTQYIGMSSFDIPARKVGMLRYRVGYHLWEFQSRLNNWVDLGFSWSELKYFINAMPTPFYRAFVARGVRPEDRIVNDPIVDIIRSWGFETVTLPIEVVPEKGEVARTEREEIMRSDCLIAIATRRILDGLTGLWRTLEWLHGETGIAWGVDKPMLILKERGLLLEGLPEYLIKEKEALTLEFDPLNPEELKPKLDVIMPTLREWIASKRREEFANAVIRAASIAIPALLIGGIVGFLVGSSKR
jgi:hypothetical protein